MTPYRLKRPPRPKTLHNLFSAGISSTSQFDAYRMPPFDLHAMYQWMVSLSIGPRTFGGLRVKRIIPPVVDL